MPTAPDEPRETALLHEQITYYRARAAEYDASLRDALEAPEQAELAQAAETVRRQARGQKVLEIACGTGAFTQAAAEVSAHLTALDAAPEMLALNQRRTGERGVRYVQANIFEWTPVETYDLVFFTFWLSHVPPARLPSFLATVRQALHPGGQVLIVDEFSEAQQRYATDGLVHQRTLASGAQYQIVKVYYEPAVVARALADAGFEAVQFTAGQHFCQWLGRAG